MNALRTFWIIIASLSLVGVAEAQKSGGKPGGGGGGSTPTPYTPTVINVTCDGTGTKLQDALNSLNPVANVYEVRVSGVCPEPISIDKFPYLYLRSADFGQRASIGAVTVTSYSQSVYLDRINIVNKTNETNLVANNVNRIDANDLGFYCERANGEVCQGVFKWLGRAYFAGLRFYGGGWGDLGPSITARRSWIEIQNRNRQSTDSESDAICLDVNQVQGDQTSLVRVYQGADCPILNIVTGPAQFRVSLMSGSKVSGHMGPFSLLSLEDRSYARGYTSAPRIIEEMVDGVTCDPLSVVNVETDGDGTNYCPTLLSN